MVTETEIKAFCEAVQDKVTEGRPSKVFKYTISAEWGKKNIRIVVNETTDSTPFYKNISVFCFVDIETGNILKAAGWKAPAKGVRGNIKNGANDVTAYGAVYLRG